MSFVIGNWMLAKIVSTPPVTAHNSQSFSSTIGEDSSSKFLSILKLHIFYLCRLIIQAKFAGGFLP